MPVWLMMLGAVWVLCVLCPLLGALEAAAWADDMMGSR